LLLAWQRAAELGPIERRDSGVCFAGCGKQGCAFTRWVDQQLVRFRAFMAAGLAVVSLGGLASVWPATRITRRNVPLHLASRVLSLLFRRCSWIDSAVHPAIAVHFNEMVGHFAHDADDFKGKPAGLIDWPSPHCRPHPVILDNLGPRLPGTEFIKTHEPVYLDRAEILFSQIEAV
jgi:hypothetical protein